MASPQNNQAGNWDVVQMTQLLITLGFQLEHLDFEASNGETNPTLDIQIRCGSSRLVSRLTAGAPECLCPENGHNSSFWEVQGTAPSENTKGKSSNLLPEVSSIVGEKVQALMEATLKLLNTTNTIEDVDCLSNKENTAPPVAIKIEDHREKLDTSSSTQILLTSLEDDVFPNHLRGGNDRDIRIIEQLSEARYKVDQALLMLTLNGSHNSLLMVTPQKPSASSSPRLSALKNPQALPVNTYTGSRKRSFGNAPLMPPRGENLLKRRSVGSLEQSSKREPIASRVASGGAFAKKKLTVKENITSNLRKNMKTQSMPKLPTKK